MSEVLLSDKEIIEKLTKEKHELEKNIQQITNLLYSKGFNNLDELIDFIDKNKRVEKKINKIINIKEDISNFIGVIGNNDIFTYQCILNGGHIYFNVKLENIKSISNFSYIIEHNGFKNKLLTYDGYKLFPKDNKNILEKEYIKLKKELEQIVLEKEEYKNKLEEMYKKEKILLTPSSSSDNKNNLEKSKNKFDNKNLSILERCNLKVYNYDNLECNNNELNILNYISSENKILIRFNSIIAEKVNENLWKKLYYFKVKNKELVDYPNNKKRFKYKYIRCKELYDKYGENLKRFSMSIYYLGILTQNEWNLFLSEFDKLYHDTFKDMEACQYKYNDNKICGIYDCNIKHQDNKENK